MSTKTFNKLAGKVTKEYEKKGMSSQKAKEVGQAVAAKVKMEKQAKAK